MALLDIIITITIAIMYNLLVHSIASAGFKDMQYSEKQQNTIIMMVIFGAIGVLVSKYLEKKNKIQTNISKGLLYGGILLVIMAIMINWSDIASELRMFVIVLIFGIIVWYDYYRNNNLTNN